MNLFSPFKGTELTPTQQRLWRATVFLLRLIVLSVPLYIILSSPGLLLPMQHLAAGNSFWMLSYAGYPVTQEGIAITINTPGAAGGQPFTFFITEDCTGWKSMLFFFALVFAVAGVAMKKRLLGLIAGISLIWIGNLARIFILVSVQQAYGTQAAMFVHDIFWQAGLIALVLVLWGVWLLKSGAWHAGNNINQKMQDKL